MLEWFDGLLTEGEAGIDRLIHEQTIETVQLDFKEKADASNGKFSDTDKSRFAKALSAFSNSAGGLLVFGLKARKGQDGIDCAQLPKPIANIDLFHSQATGLVGQLLQPKHEGIRLGVIRTAAEPGTGYLIVAVERSERRPHRSEASGQKQYFKRAGDSSFEMEHYDIEDAFKRATVPELSLACDLEQASIDGAGTKSFKIALKLYNPSGITAKYPYLYIADLQGATADFQNNGNYTFQSEGVWRCYFAGVNQVVNPSTKSTVVRLEAGIRQINGAIFEANGSKVGTFLKFKYRFGCENAPMKESDTTLTVGDLYNLP